MVHQLRQLIQRYSASQITYGEFRRQFVRFMAASDQDPVIERLYDFVEGVCSGFDHGYVNEVGLKAHLQQIVPSRNTAQQAENILVSDLVVFVPNIVGMQVTSASNAAIRMSSPVANMLRAEPELSPALTY